MFRSFTDYHQGNLDNYEVQNAIYSEILKSKLPVAFCSKSWNLAQRKIA